MMHYESGKRCNHCGSRDCAGIKQDTKRPWDRSRDMLICAMTGKRIVPADLLDQEPVTTQ